MDKRSGAGQDGGGGQGQGASSLRVRISVRSLVEFILRSGDIDNRHGGPAEKEAMQEGSRLHRRLQARMGGGYRAEVPLQADVEFEGFTLTVEGRADGIFTMTPGMAALPGGPAVFLPGGEPEPGEETVFIDEIKGVYRDLAYLEKPFPVHLAQAKCYAHIYASRQGLQRIGVQMTYGNLASEDVKRFCQVFDAGELAAWFAELAGRYEKWARYQIEWRQLCRASCRQAEFPFPWRPGQKKVAQDVYRTILRKKKLFIQAPTGTGKTISAVFPAVKAVGEGLVDRIFYMTAKTITRTVAEEAFSLMKERGLRLKVLTLTAKEKICFCGEPECNPDYCPYAKGHFDRVNDAVFEMISGGDAFSREAVLGQARKWMVCPFEFSLDLSLWADAVICDYNYVFDPRARLKRFFGEGVRGEYLFLIDEAHNLVERGREMFSASLYKEDFLELKKVMSPYSRKLARTLESCNRHLLRLKREAGADFDGEGTDPAPDRIQVLGGGLCRIQKEVGVLPVHLMNFCGAAEEYLEELRMGRQPALPGDGPAGFPAMGKEKGGDAALREKREEANRSLLDLYFQVRSFLDVCDRLDDNYVIYTELCADGRFLVRLYCVDISRNLQECLDRGKSTIYFSATLLPVNYYKSLLSTCKDDYAIYAHSSFASEKRQVLIGTDTSSLYARRTADEYRKTARYVLELVRAKEGNYMVFFSSYRMLEDVAEAFTQLCFAQGVRLQDGPEPSPDGNGEEAQAGAGLPDAPRIMLLRQTAGMDERAREEFLEAFCCSRSGSLVGFCVMGGIFGEGIDLKNDRLIGAVIVGTGLPQVCNEREILKRFYDGRGQDGFFYAYLCPGMNRVLQSAGRVIRTDEDEGVILLLDGRFAQERYRSMFPAEWEQLGMCTLASVRARVAQFWGEREKRDRKDEQRGGGV